MAHGSCNCGTVAFEINANLSDVYICHCSICRRYTGSNGVAVVIVANETFSWLRGKDQIGNWIKPNADWHAYFCSLCGSALPGPNDEARMFVPAGLLSEGDDDLKVAHRIWVGSKAGWDEIGDNGKQHKEEIAG